MTANKQLLKIAELSEITGVPKDSIRYYVKEGLLPAPRKTSRNMAYYEYGMFVPRIRLIKELQERRYMPLRIIKEILSTEGGPTTVEELDTLSALDGKVFAAGLPEGPDTPLPRETVANRVGLSEDQLMGYERVGVLSPVEQDETVYYQPADIRLAEAIAEMHKAGYTPELGFPPENYQIYVDAIDLLARRELGFFAQAVTGRREPDAAAKMAEEGILVVNRMLGVLREKTLLRLLREYRTDMEGGQRPASD